MAKNSLSFVLALILMIISLQSIFSTQHVVKAYEKDLLKNFYILVVSQSSIDKTLIQTQIANVQRLESISVADIVQDIKKSFKNDFAVKLDLPHYYKLYLSYYPTPKQLRQISQKIKGIRGILKVDNFAKAHNKTFFLLKGFGWFVTFFGVFFIAVNLMLIYKEMLVFQYENTNRLFVMSLFGASNMQKSKILLMSSALSVCVALVVCTIVFLAFEHSILLEKIFDSLGLAPVDIFRSVDMGITFVVSFFVALILPLIISLNRRNLG